LPAPLRCVRRFGTEAADAAQEQILREEMKSMLGYLYFAAFEACGVMISDRLLRRYGRMARLWLGLCMGLILLMWLPSLFAFFMNFTAAAHWCALGTALIGTGAAFLLPAKKEIRVKDTHEPPVWSVLAVMLPVTAVMAYMQYTHIIRPDVSGALMTGQSTYGDLNLHLGIATGLVNAEYPPEYTILPGTLLGYPFLMDAMSGSLYLMGMELRWAFILPGVLMTALVAWGFVMLAWEMVHDVRAVLLASALLFLNGGLGFIYVIDGALGDSSRWLEVFTGFYKAPANLVDENIRWVNVLVDMMLPQRTLLAGWCVVLPALWLLERCVREKDRKLFVILGIWAGAMPMIHTHSFLALGMISAAVMFGCLYHMRKGNWRAALINFLWYGGIAVALALPQLLTWTFPQTAGGGASGSLTIRPNWVNWDGNGLIDEYFWFWIKNVGPVYLFMVPAALAAGKKQRMFALGCLFIYAVAEFIQFQPNPYDNNKLFYVAFIVMLPLAAKYLVALYERMADLPGRQVFACAFLIVSLLSGVLSVVRECVSEYQLYGAHEMEATEFLMENRTDDTVVLTGTQHNNPVCSVGGMKIVCGTGSFLYYHGIDYSVQQRDVQKMYEDPAGSRALFEKYGVDYIYVSSHESYNYNVNDEALNAAYPLVFDNGVRVWAVSDEAQAALESVG